MGNSQEGSPGVPGNWQGTNTSSGSGKMGKGPFSFLGSDGGFGGMPQMRQLVLQAAAEGIMGNGVATISPDNTFLMVANLPPPNVFQSGGSPGGKGPVYATYLVDKKGQTGFLAGVMAPVGNGVYRAQFNSPVPLAPYERVVVSVENPQYLGQAPRGPIILKVKEATGPATFVKPFRNAAGSLWGKISGLFGGGGKVPVPGPETYVPEAVVSPVPEALPGGPGAMLGAGAAAGAGALAGAAAGVPAGAGIAAAAANGSPAGGDGLGVGEGIAPQGFPPPGYYPPRPSGTK